MNTKVKKVNRLFILLICAFIFGSMNIAFFGGIIGAVWKQVFGSISSSYESILQEILVVFPPILMLSFGGYYVIKNKISLKRDLRFNPISFPVIILVILMAFIMLPLITFINAFSMMFSTNLVNNALDELTQKGILYAIITVAVLPALMEEFVYRGILGQTYIKVNWKKGVLLSSFLFGIMHVNFNQFSYAFILGIIFMIVLEITDSIYSTMILHFIVNGFNVAMVFLISNGKQSLGKELEKALDENQELTWHTVLQLFIPAVVSFILICLLIKLLAKMTGRSYILKNKLKGIKENNTVLEDGQISTIDTIQTKLWSWHITVGTIICAIYALLVEIGSKR